MTRTEAPWAMQLVARAEKIAPPTVADVCAAAALAVIGVLEDERAQPDGPWHDALIAWQGGGRIRKLVRRGRAGAWAKAQQPEGFTASAGRAEVRAYRPSPMDEVPPEVARLQIQSTPLEEPELLEVMAADAQGLLVVVTPNVEMSWGKRAAQCSHAGQLLWRDSTTEVRARWAAAGRPISVVHATATLWEAEQVAAAVQVRDGGFTEIPAGTLTATARWQSSMTAGSMTQLDGGSES